MQNHFSQSLELGWTLMNMFTRRMIPSFIRIPDNFVESVIWPPVLVFSFHHSNIFLANLSYLAGNILLDTILSQEVVVKQSVSSWKTIVVHYNLSFASILILAFQAC